MSPEELRNAGIVSFEQHSYQGMTAIEIKQSWEQWQKQDVHKIIGGDYSAEDFQASCEQFRAWCEKHNVHYYAAPKEDFSELRGLREAHKAGRKYIILEDMS